MGILREPASFIKALRLPAGFSVCELGNQQMSGLSSPAPASEFYAALGCGRYVSIDGNGRGTVTADLNAPVTSLGLGTFDLVTDFGTGEHIFDQAQVWRTMHELTAPGGYMAFDRPHQGYGKHCFYLTNPCLYRDLADANAYEIVTFRTTKTDRGWLARGIYRRPKRAAAFRAPQQGRYRSSLQFMEVA